MTRQKEVLITGIRGFIGRNLQQYLKNCGQFHITGASDSEANLCELKSSLDDVCSYQSIYNKKKAFHAYIHLAGKVIDNRMQDNEEEFYKINYEQTKKLFDCFAEDPKAGTFIFISTIHVLTEKPSGILDENYEPRPFTPYGKSKHMAEKYIIENCPSHKSYYILRPSMVHGPGNKGNLNLLFGLINKGIPYPLGSINNKRSFVSIDNLSFIIRELLMHDIESGLYHIADDDPTYTHDLIQLISGLSGRKPLMVNISPKMILWLAKIGNYLPIYLDEHRFRKLTEDFVVSNQKIKKAIGKPLPVKAADGLKKTIYSFLEKPA